MTFPPRLTPRYAQELAARLDQADQPNAIASAHRIIRSFEGYEQVLTRSAEDALTVARALLALAEPAA